MSTLRRTALLSALVLASAFVLYFLALSSPSVRAAPDATLVVNSATDDDDGSCAASPGDCTLREAINAANATVGVKETIKFSIPGAGVHTINVSGSGLPTISDPVVINGYTQPGAHPNTLADGDDAIILIELNGATANAGVNGLTITAGNSTVKGLVINRFKQDSNTHAGGDGILLQNKGGDLIAGNFIGTDTGGTTDLGNQSLGILAIDIPNNTIGGTTPAARNLVSGNNSTGVALLEENASQNIVQGNFIGTDKNGSSALANSGSGIALTSGSNNLIGGTVAGARNVVSGNSSGGIRILNSGTLAMTSNLVQGNYIGVKSNGTQALPNGATGIDIEGSPNSVIGGTDPGAGNVISANTGDGIFLSGLGIDRPDNDVIEGNYIGTDKTGTLDLGNGGNGIQVNGTQFDTIGGAVAQARNIISGNGQSGIWINGSTSTPNTHNILVQGNYIGTDVTGMNDLGNSGSGVWIHGQYDNTIVGNVLSGNAAEGVTIDSATAAGNRVRGNLIGVKATGSGDLHNDSDGVYVAASNNYIGPGNTIAFNGGSILGKSGVAVEQGTANLITRNSIFSNSKLGIDLGAIGVTANDAGSPPDGDTGANNLQNFPVIDSAASSTSTIVGSLTSIPSTRFRLEFFSSPNCDPSGNGEGKTFLGTRKVTTNGIGKVSFSVVVPTGFRAGQAITATATDPSGNTSEFSACKTAS